MKILWQKWTERDGMFFFFHEAAFIEQNLETSEGYGDVKWFSEKILIGKIGESDIRDTKGHPKSNISAIVGWIAANNLAREWTIGCCLLPFSSQITLSCRSNKEKC